MIFGKSIKSTVMKVISSKLEASQKNWEQECKDIDAQAKASKETAFNETVKQFTKLFGDNQNGN